MGDRPHVRRSRDQDQPVPPGDSGGAGPMPQMKLTPDEIRVLKECGRESFWYRCVPFSIALMSGTQMLVNKGFLKPNPQMGSFIKLSVAAAIGYLLGKVSYQSACKSKILRLEDSRLADMIRQGGRSPYQLFSEQPAVEQEPMDPTNERSQQESRDLEAGFDANKYKGLDESTRPNLDSVPEGSVPWQKEETTPEKNVSYDDLRHQNRQVFEERQAAYQRQSPSRPPVSIAPPAPKTSTPSAQSKGSKKNEYGDVWDD